MGEANNSILIKDKALSLGFSACGIAPVHKLTDEEDRLGSFLSNNYHGEMGYLANHFDKRLDPSLLVPGARSVVVVLMNYYPALQQEGKDIPLVSKYAYGADYHQVIKDKLHLLFQYIRQSLAPANGRVFVDSAPLLEKAWALQAGLGWIGKNGLLLNRRFGSFFFIGELIIDLELDYDNPYQENHCGRCNRCLDACPTRAFVNPGTLDARHCISYMTIESKSEIDNEFKPLLGNRIFGCDTCQDVCPWNRKPQPHNTVEFNPPSGFINMTKEDWETLDENQFDQLFSHSAIKRAGFQKLKQNIRSIS